MGGVSNSEVTLWERISRVAATGGLPLVLSKGTTTILIAAVMGVFYLAMLLFGDRILKIVHGEKYAGYGVVIAVLAFAQLVPSAVNTPLTSSLMAMERTDVEFKCYLAATLVTLTRDRALRSKMDTAGRRRISEHFNWDAEGTQMTASYAAVLRALCRDVHMSAASLLAAPQTRESFPPVKRSN